MAATVVVEVSNGCRIFSVDQSASRPAEMASKRHSAALTGPSSANARAIASRPPCTSSISGGMSFIITKYSAMDIRIAQGAAASSHSG